MVDYLISWWEMTAAQWRGSRSAYDGERGSVTMENVIWALAVIVIAGIVVLAITTYVTNHSSALTAQ